MDHADPTEDRSHAPLDDDLRREPREAATGARTGAGDEDAPRRDHTPGDGDPRAVQDGSAGPRTGVDVDDRWRATQARFLESPREAVAAADELATDAIEAVRRQLGSQRAQVAEAWQRDDADTEDLRTAMLRYRELLDRLTRIG